MQTPSLLSRFTRLLVVAVTVLCLGIGTGVPSAQAVFGVGDTVAVVGDLPRAISETRGSIWSNLVGAGVGALFNAMQLFLGQLAYDAANYIASGGKGQSALFYKKGFLGYFQDVGGDAVGDFIGSLGGSGSFFSTLGVNLCQPRNPALLLRVQVSLGELGQQAFPNVGVAERFQRPRPRCQLQEIANNYENLYETMSNTDVLQTVASSFDATSNELGTVTSIYNRFLDNVQERLTTAAQDRQEGQGFNSVQGVISGTIRTPASLINQATADFLVKQPATNQSQLVGAILNNAWNIGAPQLLWYTASIFTNTLVSKLLKNVFEKGIFSSTGLYTPTISNSIDSVLLYGKTDSRNANINLKDISFFKQVTYDALAELQACPTDGTRSLFNCSIDQGLFAAISAKGTDGAVTVAQAIGKSYLHPDWQLIPETETRLNTSPTCYSTAYCVGNIQKLRSLRILSAGFEFAANSPANIARCRTGTCVTLREVIAGFTNCNAEDQLDAEHPWCHLIDPNWIITSVPQQCALSGFGDTLLSEKVGVRREQCSDIQTCLKRDGNGQCVGGYGYCMAEKSVYRFQGDECPARFASCRTYTDRNNSAVSYLRYSVDRGLCSADNVGCTWYASTRLATPGRDNDWLAATTTGPRVYFDKNVETCPSDAEGCTKLYAANAGTPALNLVQNPSFERRGTNPATLLNWMGSGEVPLSLEGVNPPVSDQFFTGAASFKSDAGTGYTHQAIPVVGGRTYTLSALVKVVSRSVSGANFDLNFAPKRRAADGSYQALTLTELNRYYASRGTCAPAASVGLYTMPGYQLVTPQGVTMDSLLSADWRRFECTFVLPEGVVIGDLTVSGRDVAIDAVQLEEGEYATDFIDGLNQSLPEVHLKVAPDEFACSGSASDHQACGKFAQVCRQSEAGCQGYTDITGGGAEIPAILSSNDSCPSECVGYAEYRKSASAFDLARDADTRLNDPQETSSTAFIANTAQQCSQADVGCEAFTVLDGVRAGQTLAYNYLRTCEKPDANSETFFTWEGADTTGYQLRTWSLKKDAAAGGPRVLAKLEPDQLNFKEPQTCNESLWRSGFDPDCRQFYSAEGRVYYRYFSQTVLSTADCTQLRYNGGSSADCNKTGGTFNAGGECVYSAVLAESRVCRQEAISCRRYQGSGSGNVQTVFSQDFRASTTGGFLGTTTTEALLVGDSSLRLPVNGTSMTSVTVPTDDASLYRVTFWAKSPATTTLLALKTQDPLDLPDHRTFAGANTVGSVQVGPEWQRYTIGLFAGAAGATSTSFGWISNAVSAVYLDEVVVSRVQDVVYVKRNTWNTPASCDRSPDGAREPQAMLGCRAYRDRTGATVDARRFTRLCRETAISCRAFVDTRNSDQTGEVSFTKSDTVPLEGYAQTATTTRSADRYLYLLDTPDKRCTAENASCRAFGRPNFSADRNTFNVAQPFTTVYLKDDITKYDQMLCKPSELFCDAFNHKGQTEYFRDPGTHQCEYRDGVRLEVDNSYRVPAGLYNGWFQRGNNIPCYPQILTNGNTFGLASAGDDPALYDGWVGSCPAEQAECTEFRDPNDKTDPAHQSGKPYFLIRNDKIDTASCNGSVNQSEGCVMFRDLSESQVSFSSKATYAKYKLNNYKGVTPIDCSRDSGNELCQNADNDANLILKVAVDRDCAQWLGCKSSETVFDAGSGQYRDICTNLALCDVANAKPNDPFCAHYVDRSTTTTEPILARGIFFDAKLYSSRKTGLGTFDYSGFSLPDSFQVSDVEMTRVGAEGALDTPDHQYRFANEYRLAAAIPMPPAILEDGGTYRHIRAARGNEAFMLDGTTIARAYPNLFLCQQMQTGRIGYYRPDDRSSRQAFNCYIAVGGALGQSTTTDALSFAALQSSFSSPTAETEALLTQAFPPSECRAYPEEDSPFPNTYVDSWDLSKNPPKPLKFRAGYGKASLCEYGEDCACTYKRATYGDSGAANKFYNIYAAGVPTGICAGGPRDGQSCIPETIFKDPSSVATGGTGASGAPEVKAIEGSNASQTCGSAEAGGRCIALKTTTIVRGNFGACLERDSTRVLPGSNQSSACLTWNPNPLLFGVNDPFHFVPTAGYLPPQNSGQYYCLSPTRNPKNIRFDTSFFIKQDDKFAGSITKLDYDDDYVSEGGGPPSGNKPGSSISGGLPSGTPTAAQCEDTDDDQDEGYQNDVDVQGLRIVNAGMSPNNYTETFFPVQSSKISSWLYGMDGQTQRAMYDYNFGNFMISPMRTRNGTARLGCGYQQDWVDNIGAVDYDTIESVSAADKSWQDQFNQNYNPSLNRGSEAIVFADDGHPVKKTCVTSPENPFEGDCYFKSWSTGYRVPGGQPLFNAFDTTGGNRANFPSIQSEPYETTCSADKPYFAIRAVFQAKVPTAGAGSDRTQLTLQNASTIPATWSFAGFWVAACGGSSARNDIHFMYMYIEANSGDICTDLAEVVSRNSHQDAAFTDRVAPDSIFTVPQLGIQYNARFAPFSSALNLGPAGTDPLYQTGQEVAGFSPLNPPTFLAAGYRTYAADGVDPKQKWAYLSNIFARIYRVYRYEEKAVTAADTACLSGPFKGRLCTPSATQGRTSTVDPRSYVYSGTPAAGANGVSAACSANGICDPSLFDDTASSQTTSNGACNSLSGINAGMSCMISTEVCHQGVLQRQGGEVKLRGLPCQTQTGWTLEDSEHWKNADVVYDRQQAADRGAFRCPGAPNSMRRENQNDPYSNKVYDARSIGQRCSNPTDKDPLQITGSPECPERVLDGIEVRAPASGETPSQRADRTIRAFCQAPGGARLTASASAGPTPPQGRCNVHIPTLTYGSLTLPEFTMNPDSETSPACSSDYDCSFTQMNYYHDIPGGAYPHNGPGGASTEFSYYSYRSIRFLTYGEDRTMKDAAAWTEENRLGAERFGTTPATAFVATDLKRRTAGTETRPGGGSSRDYALTTSLPNMSPDPATRGRISSDSGEFATTPAELNRTPGPGSGNPSGQVQTHRIYVPFDDARHSGGLSRGTATVEAYMIGACAQPSSTYAAGAPRYGRCVGGLKNGSLCRFPDPGSGDLSCLSVIPDGAGGSVDPARDATEGGNNVCGPVTTERAGERYSVAQCTTSRVASTAAIGQDPESDDNVCTHKRGYIPRLDLCPDPSDEFCGLIAYNSKNAPRSLSPGSVSLLPTDVTQGLHTPNFLGLADPVYPDNRFGYIAPYAPAPPMIASPNTAKCPIPGQCEINSLNSFSLNGQSEGQLSVPGGQMKANILFYAWAAHNQMPLRAVYIDWGDLSLQQLPDARLKNHKAYCNVKRECSGIAGLTCSKNTDCPPGGGTCEPIGVCTANGSKTCRADSDCGGSDRCNLRTLFGNTSEACEENYFDFSHLFTCTGSGNLPNCAGVPGRTTTIPASVAPGSCYFGAYESSVSDAGLARPTCTANAGCYNFLRDPANRLLAATTPDNQLSDSAVVCNIASTTPTVTTRCSRDPARLCRPGTPSDCAAGDSCIEGLAPPGGCWDGRINSCRFTPRVMVMDNWGWCTGECRGAVAGNSMVDTNANPTTPQAKHVYGGCYSGQVLGSPKPLYSNVPTAGGRLTESFVNECLPNTSGGKDRPWIVYPGAINLRSSVSQ